MNWHRLSIEETFELLDTTPQGLAASDAEEKLVQYGPNELQEGKKKSIAGMLLAQFKDVMILILLAAAIISGIIGDLTDTIVILIIVLLNAVIGFFQEYRAEKAMQALKQMAVTQARVLREGNSNWIPATALVPGDVVLLEAGNAVPADIRIVESVNLKIEEAALTGESHAIDKITHSLETDDLPIGDRSNMAFKGTFVTYGRGTGIVIATGMQTELGRIARMLQEEETLTPLQQRMASFGKNLSILVLFLCIFCGRLATGRRPGEDGTHQYLPRRGSDPGSIAGGHHHIPCTGGKKNDPLQQPHPQITCGGNPGIGYLYMHRQDRYAYQKQNARRRCICERATGGKEQLIGRDTTGRY